MDGTSSTEAQRLREIADRLNCVTEQDLCILAETKPGTVEAWRKRGIGPAYVRIGNRVLYPLKDVAAHLETLKRERNASGKALL